jgi:hypothetical protein
VLHVVANLLDKKKCAERARFFRWNPRQQFPRKGVFWSIAQCMWPEGWLRFHLLEIVPIAKMPALYVEAAGIAMGV